MRATGDDGYANFCLNVGNGTQITAKVTEDNHELQDCVIRLPSEIACQHEWEADDLMSWVYEGLPHVLPAQWCQFYEPRAVVTPTNDTADDLNHKMLQQLDCHSEKVYCSNDSAVTEVDAETPYPQ